MITWVCTGNSAWWNADNIFNLQANHYVQEEIICHCYTNPIPPIPICSLPRCHAQETKQIYTTTLVIDEILVET